MDKTLAEIFRLKPDLQDFFLEVRRLEGDFPFNREDMEALGQAYFERYPEKFVQRNLEEVRLGYQLTRFCLLEKSMAGIKGELKDFFRQAFAQPDKITGLMADLTGSGLGPELATGFGQLQAVLDGLKAIVDELPKGMVKERFLGGLSSLFNVCYLLKVLIARSGQESLQD
ncbi:MAG: hypothetical protein OP8BY_0950 [Candidatus Saccharicenans subterraneus]|uniref:Uncharacterized protein n=1 Tax=Candidatus Saccharicenans subterraneus TaxID=2508984 RepID=A0A3E2BQK6_9BACT|nr:MAG: hypothetical protein OP8BY_0950 [Candidatus Saccharicenans subterraneum]